ncbi:acylphosphatase [Candidatus Micrarchaeota archaeon]|nr:acylphosphatase [Candidatus Micrarchaeota archaeon]
MTKAVFYIKDKVQDVGYRVHIVGKILESPLEGTAVNTADGSVKVMLRGEKEHILQFYEELKKEKPELAENPAMSKPEFNEALEVPDAMRSSQHLMLGQFSKGVGFLAEMNQKLETGFNGMNQKLETGFNGMNQTMTGMNQKLDESNQKLDSLEGIKQGLTDIKQTLVELPKKIAEAIS